MPQLEHFNQQIRPKAWFLNNIPDVKICEISRAKKKCTIYMNQLEIWTKRDESKKKKKKYETISAVQWVRPKAVTSIPIFTSLRKSERRQTNRPSRKNRLEWANFWHNDLKKILAEIRSICQAYNIQIKHQFRYGTKRTFSRNTFFTFKSTI